MRRRRKKNSGARWAIALVAVATLAWAGRDYWMGHLPTQAPADVQPLDTVVAAPAAEPAPAIEPEAPGTQATTATAAATATATFMSEAEARDAAARAAREQTLKVQTQLREARQAHKEEAEAAASDKTTRCIGGQKMKRVDNGWVQAGTC